MNGSTQGYWHPLVRWNTADWTARVLTDPEDRGGSSGYISLTPDQKGVLQAREERFTLWSLETGKVVREMEAGHLLCRPHAASPKGTRIALHDLNRGGHKILGVEDFKEFGHFPELRSIAFIDEDHFAAASQEGIVRVAVAGAKVAARAASPHRGRVCAAAFHPNGREVVTLGVDQWFRTWDLEAGRETSAFRSDGDYESTTLLALAPDGRHLAAAYFSRDVRIFSLSEKRLIARVGNEAKDDRDYMPNAQSLAFADDRTLRLGNGWHGVRSFDLREGVVTRRDPGPDGTSGHLALSPDGSQALRFRYDGEHVVVSSVDAATGRARWTVRDDSPNDEKTRAARGYVRPAAIHRRWAAYFRGLRVRVLETETGREAAVRSFADDIVSITADPAGRYWIVALEKSVLLLHAATLRDVATLDLPGIRDAQFSPDGRRFFLRAPRDSSLRIFTIEPAP